MSADEQALVIEHLPRVRAVVWQLARRLPSHVDLEELVQAGSLGLIDAARRFDPRHGCSFSTYAQIRIRGAVMDELRSLDWVPRSVRRHVQRVEGAALEVERREGRRAECDEVADLLGLSAERFETLRRLLNDAPLRRAHDPDGEQADVALAHRRQGSPAGPLHTLSVQRICDAVEDALASLSPRERTVVSLLYWHELTLADVGKTLGLHGSRVRVLQMRALVRLRRRLRAQLE